MMPYIVPTLLIQNVLLNIVIIKTKKSPENTVFSGLFFVLNLGNDLLSHSLTAAVSSALEGLTSVFEMGTGGTPPVRSPRNYLWELKVIL
jgi:hypothetical protein